jgi:hypothetical protein
MLPPPSTVWATEAMIRFSFPVSLLFVQQAQSAQQRHAHVHQRRQLPRKHRQRRRLDAARAQPLPECGMRPHGLRPPPERCRRRLPDQDGEQPHFLDAPQRLALIDHVQRAFASQPAGVHCFV